MSWLTANGRLLAEFHPDLADFADRAPDPTVQAAPTPAGPVTLVAQRDGRRISLHSRRDPVKEGAGQAGRLPPPPAGGLITALGLGLGYHLREAVQNLPVNAPLAVIEADPGVFRAALEHCDMSWLLARPQTRLIVGVERDEAVKRLYRWRLAHHLAESVIWRQAAAAGLHPEYYHAVEAQLAASEASGPRAALIAPRLNRDRLKVLIFDAGYYLTREINAALHRLGHETRLLPMDSGDACGDGAVSRLLTAVAEFQPDLAVTVNHLGLDQEGVLADVLAGVQLPLASWFVDSPLFILREERRPAKDCAVFVWDADYVQPVKDRGYQRVFFLPLAADERLFKPLNGRPNPLCDWACDVAFVGDSMRRSLSERIERLAPPSDLWPAMEKAARLFRDGTDRSPEAAVGRAGLANHPFVQSLSPRGRLRLHELITWWATHLARVELVAALQGLSPTVVGDAGWRALLNGGSYQWRGPVDYYRDLPRFYPLCRVNLNVTSQQMKGGVNQRVFDAPAAGAFLLTDHRDQLDLLFEPGRETAVYGSPDQALDLCRWYLGRDRDRLALARRARRRILAEHTYTHRLSGLLGCMKREFGP